MQPAERFTNRADNYARFRPGYPEAVVETLRSEAPLPAGARIADIGAGTGISSELLVRHGYWVTAVEPNAAMRTKAVAWLGADARFRAVAGTAEDTGLPAASFDGVVCAQAFHWFRAEEARREFRRILRPGGVIAVMWNLRRSDDSPFMAGLEALLMAHCPDYAGLVVQETQRSVESVMALGHSVRTRVLPWVDTLDRETFMGRLLSASYVPLGGAPGHDAVIAGANALFDRCARNGRVDMLYDTRLYWTL